MAADRRKTSQSQQFVLLGAAMALAVVSGMAGIVRHAAQLGPAVGDLVSFDPAHRAPFESNVRLIANRPQQAACELDVAIIQQSGGSLMLERRGGEPDRRYRVHWSGPRTSQGAQDCGSQADLMLSRIDIDTLATAAGGFGVDHSSVQLLR